MAKRNRSSEAMEQFAEVVRLKPEFVEGHLNYGVALARAQRFDEAIARFRETLRRDPGNVAAKKFLDQALAMRGGK